MRLKLAAAAVGLAFALPVLADTTITQQFGSDNYANIDQTNSLGSTVFVTQIGTRNRVGDPETGTPGVTQTNLGGFESLNTASIYQQGSDNQAWSSQNSGSNQFAFIQQGGWICNANGCTYTGDAHHSYAAWNMAGTNEFLSIVQGGNFNRAWGSQNGSNNSTNITQNGSSNFAGGLHQEGSGGAFNFMSIAQSGSGNVAWTLNQTGSGNTMDITQSGSGNASQFLFQGGDGNVVTIAQNGSFNLVQSSSQFGTNNSVNISQTGNFHGVGYTQFGSGNNTIVTQH